MRSGVVFLVDRSSFPKECPELQDFASIIDPDADLEFYDTEDPTAFFKKAMGLTEGYELVVPVTRNFYIRDRLRMEGVSLVVCL